LPEVFPELGDIFAPGAKVIHIDLNAYEIAKNHPVDLGTVSDPQLTLAALVESLERKMNIDKKRAAAARSQALTDAKQGRLFSELEADRRMRGSVPMQAAFFMEELAKQVPAETIFFDEALTNSPALTRHLPPRKAGTFFQTRGGSLGVGIPGALGVQLVHPDKTVIGFSGDGGAMYTIQALWSAARHKIPAKFVICNNSSYKLLQLNIQTYWKERSIAEHAFPLCFDLSRPQLRFDKMAHSMGMAGLRLEKPSETAGAIRQMLDHPGPFLIDLVLGGNVSPELIEIKCGQ